MKQYYLQTLLVNNLMYYELSTIKGPVFQIIEDIDKDDLSFIEEYKDPKYNCLVSQCSESLDQYCKLNRKELNNKHNDISYVLVLIMIIMSYDLIPKKEICPKKTHRPEEEECICDSPDCLGAACLDKNYVSLKKRYTYLEFKIRLNSIFQINFNEYFDLDEFICDDWFRIYKPSNKEYLLSDEDYQIIKERQDISFITLTNFGYIDFVKNMILSLEKCNFPFSLKVYCLDNESIESLFKFNKNIKTELITGTDIKQLINYSEEGWSSVVINKLKCIHKELLQSDYVLFTDSDIVYDNNYSMKYLIDNMYDYDLLAQHGCYYAGDYKFNTGFMFIKSNGRTLNVFDINRIDLSLFKCDEPYINSQKHLINYRILPKELFPINRVYEKNKDFIKAFIIHFNEHRGYDKIDAMKKYNKWFL